MKQVSVPVTKQMLRELAEGKEVGWEVDNQQIRLLPTFEKPAEKETKTIKKSTPKSST